MVMYTTWITRRIRVMDLTTIMANQRKLQEEYYPKFMAELSNEQRLQDNLKHIMHETVEVERETNFKHWKQPVQVDWDKVREELVDVFIFFMNACNEANLSAHDLMLLTSRKQEINRERQRTGY